MRGDFTRDTFDPHKHYSRVLMQQGRVHVDADWNEQVAILLHLLRSLAADVIGPYGGPGFEISPVTRGGNLVDLSIGDGHYYVDGLLVSNEEADAPFGAPEAEIDLDELLPFVVYLDVWERHVTFLDDPAVREVALGGPDTATRARVTWRLRLLDGLTGTDWASAKPEWDAWWTAQSGGRGRLRARAAESAAATRDHCLTSPEAKYWGPENQLYRVEIHEGGGATSNGNPGATFKWSRDNGSVVFGVERIDIDNQNHVTTLTLESMGRDDRSGLARGDWVELVDDDSIMRNAAYDLLQVQALASGNSVVLKGVPHPDLRADPIVHAQVRRWDHKESEEHLLDEDGAVPLVEGVWIDLEDGVQVWFEPEGVDYRTGDYWLIPARTATGDVEWSKDEGDEDEPGALPPQGVQHHYAPLAYIDTSGAVDATVRRAFDQLAKAP